MSASKASFVGKNNVAGVFRLDSVLFKPLYWIAE